MAAEHYVIIGNGPSGNAAAAHLRKLSPSAKITIISDEFFPYYYRHKLRDYIVGECEESDLVVRPPEYYRDLGIRLRLGQRVTRLDVADRTLYLAHMEKLTYSGLLICVGSAPRVPEACYAFRKHLRVLGNLRHARALREAMPPLHRMVVCGGDMVSFRVAATLAAHGKEVDFLVDEDAFWPLELTPERRSDFASALEAKGVTVHCDDVLVGVEPQDGQYVARTRLGTELRCDLVGAFYGLAPAIDWLHGSGLDLERGILVDECLRTNQPGVYAAGDCAEIYRPELRNYWVSRGWPNALALGEAAARNLLGDASPVAEPPESVLQVEGIRVSTAWWREF